MQLVERHIIKENHKLFKECDKLCFLSKNLYNIANYTIRQEFIKNSKYISFGEMDKLFITTNQIDYRNLPAKVSKGILRILDRNWISFFESIKDFRENPQKYHGKPKLPTYKDVKVGRNIVPYEKGAISKKDLVKNGLLTLSKTNISISTTITYEDLISARIVPRLNHYVIEIIYNKQEEICEIDNKETLAIDLGVNNLASCVDTSGKTVIINGKPLKSINQYYDKEKGKLQSQLPKKQFKSKQINKLSNKRNNKVNDYLHKASKKLIDYCLTNDIGKIVIGYNKNWKQDVNIGKVNNQNFVNIPFNRFVQMIEYKAELVGIKTTLITEEYTSKCSFIDNETICKHDKYCGNRVKRGLFKSKDGYLINADVNGAFNILRKAVPIFNVYSLDYGIEGLAVNPLILSIIN